MIVGIVALYNPKEDELKNIEKYVDDLDYCYLLDDSGISNYEICKKLILEHPNKIEYVCNQQNMGLVASVNNGFQLSIEKGADWVLVMNPDGAFQNNAISIFRAYIANYDTSNVAIIAPQFNFDRHRRDAKQGTRTIKFPDMTGCLYNTKILNKVGYYDSNTYFYGLDIEYCIRVRRAGYKIIECSEAILNHHPAETYNVVVFGKTIFKCGKDTPQRYYYHFRSAYYIHKRYHDFYNFMINSYKFVKVILFFENKGQYFKMMKEGIRDAKRGYYGKYKG